MAKNVFRPYEFKNQLAEIVPIKAPHQFQPPEPEELAASDEFSGPTADDLRREAEAFKVQWENDRALLIQEAELQRQDILAKAEQAAFDLVRQEKERALQIRVEAEKEAQRITDEAKAASTALDRDTRAALTIVENDAREKGRKAGYDEGWADGAAEVERLVGRIHVILEKITEKRQEIIEGTEAQIVQLVLQIAKKVVKVISENQRNVVINNVLQALRKLKTRGDVVVRVNLEDLKVATDHVKEFLSLVENVKSITVVEDTTVDQGGALVETDFGEIDAKISSQFQEIEEKILELMPIRSKTPGAPTPANP
jgi:flagellar assembly protein FliH